MNNEKKKSLKENCWCPCGAQSIVPTEHLSHRELVRNRKYMVISKTATRNLFQQTHFETWESTKDKHLSTTKVLRTFLADSSSSARTHLQGTRWTLLLNWRTPPHILRVPRISHALSSLQFPDQRLLPLLNSRNMEPSWLFPTWRQFTQNNPKLLNNKLQVFCQSFSLVLFCFSRQCFTM